MFASYCAVQYVSVVKYALRSVNKGKSKTLHAIAKAERVVERGIVPKMWCVICMIGNVLVCHMISWYRDSMQAWQL